MAHGALFVFLYLFFMWAVHLFCEHTSAFREIRTLVCFVYCCTPKCLGEFLELNK